MTMQHADRFDELPDAGCWQHVTARAGFEVAFFARQSNGPLLEGTTAAFEDEPWIVTYTISVDTDWATLTGRVTSRTATGLRHTEVRQDPDRQWWVDGARRADLDGCRDIDLESSAVTNTFPVHRLKLKVGEAAEAPAAYVRATDLSVERLEQRYERLPDGTDDAVSSSGQRFQYDSPAFNTSCVLTFDTSGLILDYPGIARRYTTANPHID